MTTVQLVNNKADIVNILSYFIMVSTKEKNLSPGLPKPCLASLLSERPSVGLVAILNLMQLKTSSTGAGLDLSGHVTKSNQIHVACVTFFKNV